jgi:Tfp pilus tip-associated adhesin PilY1
MMQEPAMKANSPHSEFARKIGTALVLCALTASGHGASTQLADEPFTVAGSVKALPNIMFVLDDSGSMDRNYLPDWSGPYLLGTTVLTPAYRFFNASFNGIAYNPGTYYRPPVAYTSAGVLDTTTYPSMTGQSTATGGDGAATAGSPNWKAVPVDGYGIESTSASNLEGSAYSYTTVAGEYCDSQNLRSCTASATPTGIYTVAAPLRWCTTSANAIASTATAGTSCQASNIDNTDRSATITVTATGSVTQITVDGSRIMSAASSSGGTTATVAASIVTQINACTLAVAGNCQIAGFSATSIGPVVTITAPSPTSSSPSVTGGTTTVTAFAGAGGVTPYYFARMPAPRIAAINVAATTTTAVTGITVDGFQIMSSSVAAGAPATVAAAIAASINACTYALTGSCTKVGYKAVALDTVVTLTAPGVPAASAVVSGGAPTPTVAAFLASPRIATVTFNGTAAVTNLTVDGDRIIAANTAVAVNAAGAARAIVSQINACTNGITGLCTVAGYRATSLAGVVTIFAPGATAATPTVTGGTVSGTTAFAPSGVPGSILFTVITSTTNSYPYPGTAVKAAARTDCAGTTCTYVEEMTNYANWYAYYSTRMKMMKTAAGIAFSGVDDQFRVGYHSINNGAFNVSGLAADNQFLNPDAFGPTQKFSWYTQFYRAAPYGPTPLRTALSNMGRFYAGQLAGSTLNGVTANDPMQYSCQQNFTILSTDGYWNDTTIPKQINGTTDIGEQDHNLNRPYYDGGTQTQTISQTFQNDEQWASNTRLFEKRTQQLQTTSRQLNQTVVTTDYYPWTTQEFMLQERTKALNQTAYSVRQRTYDLKSDTYPLNESVYYITSTPRILQSYINNLTETSTPLEARTYNVTKSTQLLTLDTFRVTKSTQLLTLDTFRVTKSTQLLTLDTFRVTKSTQLLTKDIYNVTSTTSPLQKSTYLITKTTNQLQQMSDISTDGGDSFHSTGWVDVSSCTVALTGPGALTKNTVCRYNPTAVVLTGQNSCTVATASPGPTTYTVAVAAACAYEATPAVTNVASCTVVAQSGTFAAPQVACGYGAAAAPVTGLTSCTPNSQASSPYTGNRVVCSYDATATTHTTDLTTCTRVVPAVSAASPKTNCTYQAATPLAGQLTCAAATANNNTANGQVANTAVSCAYDATATTHTTDLTTCTRVVPAVSAASPKTNCTYQAATPQAGQLTCAAATANNNTANGQVANSAVSCAYDATATTHTTDLTTCTRVVPAVSAASPKTNCTYQAATPLAGQLTCAAATANNNTANGQVANTAVSCAYDATATTHTTDLTTCTRVVPAVSAASPKTNCTYQAATPQAGQLTCAAATANNNTANGQVANSAVSCAYDAAPTTTLPNQSSCTWVVPAVAASSPRTDCVYNAAANTSATVATCTPQAQSTGTTNGTTWTGPSKTCAYAAAVLTGTNLATCTAGTPSGSAPYLAYTTCGYINGTPVTGQSSCTYLADSTANTYLGPRNACAYEGTATVNPGVATCTVVAQSGSFAAPQRACAYAATAATGTGLTNCTSVAASPGPTNYAGPRVDCYYASSTLTDVTLALGSSCTVHDSGGSPYTGGARVRCTYNAGNTTSVGSCSTVAKSSSTADGTVYPTAYDCAYAGTFSPDWTNAVAACVPQAASGGSPYSGPVRECRYVARSPVPGAPYPYTATCSAAAQDNTNLMARNCTAGSFPYTVSTIVTTVNSCSTAPTTDGGSPVERRTATTCAYRAPVTVNSATCTPHTEDTVSPFLTAVTCPVTDTGWAPVTTSPIATSCVGVGSDSPRVYDGTGKVVECRNSDTTPYNFDYAFGPVPVSSCTVGTTENTATGVQTVCVKPVTNTVPPRIFSNTTAVPVLPTSCVATTAAVAPYYIWTRCNTTATSTTVMGCAATSPATDPPFYRTTTCADDGTGTRNTLADVAAYYYNTDLRTYALGNCAGAIDPSTGVSGIICSQADDLLAAPTLNNVPITTTDTSKAQHMTTFTLGLGASGYMKYAADGTGDYAAVYGIDPHAPLNSVAANPANGVCSWQVAGSPCNWPIPVTDNQTGIDDLWHAGINGHGAYFSATDPSSLSDSITAALEGVKTAGGASASPTISNPSLTPGDSYIFSSTFATVEWTGELVRRQLDPITGAVSANNDWAVQGKLDAKAYTSRTIWTFDSSVATTKLRAFTSANFAANTNFLAPNISSLTQFACITPDICLTATNQDASHAAGANLVNFLRGDRTHEGAEKNNNKYFRERTHVLGDMVNAQIVYVHLPLYNYADPGYSEFKADQSARTPIAYAGSNDGMLHAFNAKGAAATETAVEAAAIAVDAAARDPSSAALATAAAAAVATANAAVAADTGIGQEIWAYIPSMVMPHLYKLADKKYSTKHRYYVDGTPVFGDICTANCTSAATAVWKTILVGGLGKGGRGYYALDITDPASPKALWEFTDANLGYTFGNPQITKLFDGTWVVMVSSGYNNVPNPDGAGGDGVGRLYILNAGDGTLIRSISTGVGDTTTPSGLAKVTAQVVSPDSDNTAEAVYGGDLLGNLWRFDVNDIIGAAGYDAQLLATLKDGSGNAQPISTIPQVSAIPTTGEKLVYIGTGTYLHSTDATNTNQQSLYAIKDTRATGTTPATAIFDNPGGAPRPAATSAANSASTAGFVRQVQTEELCPVGTLTSICDQGQLVRTSTSYPVNFTTQNGWFIDLITPAERANTDPALALGELVVNTNAPSLQACIMGGSSYTYFLNYLTGGPVGASMASSSQVNRVVGRLLATQLASSPTLAVTKEGKLISITGLSGGGISVVQPPLPPGASVARRTSWRELIRE